eukprot:363538-Chlamydomonas_euryale.AAC.4
MLSVPTFSPLLPSSLPPARPPAPTPAKDTSAQTPSRLPARPPMDPVPTPLCDPSLAYNSQLPAPAAPPPGRSSSWCQSILRCWCTFMSLLGAFHTWHSGEVRVRAKGSGPTLVRCQKKTPTLREGL